MKYDMYYEMMEQPSALKNTFESEMDKLIAISKKVKKVDKIYLIGCGSSISTCYSVREAMRMVTNFNIEAYTGFEFVYNKKILDNENSIVICTSQSGETGDTLVALRKANDFNIPTVVISNEKDSSMVKEADYPIITRGNREHAILGTKTYITQLACLYQILFNASNYEKKDVLLEQLHNLPDLIENLLESTKEDSKKLAEKFKDEEIFYCMGSGPNFGLAFKLAMTMFMEGALKHSCPLFAGEFRHGLIERAEKDVPLIFLDSDFDSDIITKKAINFANKLEAKTIVYRLSDFTDINKLLSPFIFVIPLEWFIYYLAHFNNEDPGSTRHIGKVRYD